MLSKKLEISMASIEVKAATETQREAALDLRLSLQEAARRQACLRCEKAGFALLWRDWAASVEEHEWEARLTACGAFHALPEHEHYGFMMPFEHFFCTDEESESQVGGIATSSDSFQAPVLVRAAERERERMRLREAQPNQHQRQQGGF